MKIKLKTKFAPPPGSTSTNSNNNFEQKTIPELVNILRGTCQFDTYDVIEGVLVNRETRLRTEIQQQLQQKFELEKLQLQEKLQMEERLRIQAEEEVKKREKICEKGKRVEESYEKLLKEVKAGIAYRDNRIIKELKKKNGKLECEMKNLKEKCDDDSNKFDVMRTKNEELESKVMELRKMNEKLVEDSNKLGVMMIKYAGLEFEVLDLRKMKGKWERDGNELGVLRSELKKKNLELKKLNEKLVEDNNALDELRGKVHVLEADKNALVAGLKIQIGELEERVKNHLTTISQLEEENSKLAHEKRMVEMFYESLRTKHRELQERGNDEWEPHADPMVADFEDLTGEDVLVNVFGHDTTDAAPLRRNEDVRDSFGVAASTQPQNISDNDAQGASSASGRVKLGGKDYEIIILDDDDNDRSISQRVHGKKTIFGHAVMDEYPSSSVATQQKSKFTNAVVDTAKRKFSFPDIETSSSSDDSIDDNLPISSVVSQRKKTKM
ncbi:unnamed protein product [Trifolium pratense]|uniref:Uncharacterized protein n=1 Tax=Trifolium pratense TaxID=57577 RepID=A0ACB0IPB9_TRIPR|nr:unnamed protein product [Trifolium pratense]